MPNIEVHRYTDDREWHGWVEPEDKGWILFVAADGTAVFFGDRDPESGAVNGQPCLSGV